MERQKKMGVSHVVDYKASDVVEQLQKLGPYKYILTASGDPASQKALGELLAPTGGKFASMSPKLADVPSNVELIYAAFSMIVHKGDEAAEWRNWWYQEYLQKVISGGLIEPVKFTKVEGGLASMQQACDDVFGGKTKGKLIVNPQDE